MADLAFLRQRLAAADNLSEVARRAGVTRMTAMRIRKGANTPNLDTYNRLMLALDGAQSPAKLAAPASGGVA